MCRTKNVNDVRCHSFADPEQFEVRSLVEDSLKRLDAAVQPSIQSRGYDKK